MNNVFSLQETFAGKILHVPDYQRGYAWERRQWDELLDDLEFLASGKEHYTGSLVLHKQEEAVRDEGGQKHEVFHIVDGQQRLTTTVLLLDAIRTALSKFQTKLATGVSTSYIRFSDINGQDAFKIRLNTDCHDYFTHNVLGDKLGPQGPEIASHERLRDARQYFGEYLADKEKALEKGFPDWLLDLHDKVTQRLKLGHYLVGDSTEVGVIFEVMNNRGKPLSELEKVKNYLLYVASKLEIEDHALDTQINQAWAEIFRRLMAAGLTAADFEDRLLRAHWLMAHDPVRKNWDGSKSIKAKFDLKAYHKAHKKLLKELAAYVESLRDSVLAFAEIFAGSQSNTFSAYPKDRQAELRHWASKLPRTGVLSAFLPLLMAIRLRFPNDAETYLDALKLFEVFAFRVYRWEGRRADAGQTRLFRLGHDLFWSRTTWADISKEARQIALAYCPDKNFRDGFQPGDNNNFYGWPGLRYLLYEYEEALSKGKGLKLTWQQLQAADPEKTIEHVLPQTPNNKYWSDRFDAAARRKYTHCIGNLCLTFDNSIYGNKPFPEKCGDVKSAKPCYATSNLFAERDLAKFDDWMPDEVSNRNDEIMNWGLKRWHIESKDLPVDPLAEFLSDTTEDESENA